MKNHLVGTLVTSSIALLFAQSPLAQEIEEVVVSAQKRAQNLQDVPLAVTAFSDNFLKESNIDTFKDVISFTPGLSGASQDSFVDTITVRGINTNDFGVGTDPAIGVYVDGVYQGRSGGALSTLFDVRSMEVVKGPQGTLFGRNSTAGAISVYRNKPTEDFEGSVSAGLGSYGQRETELVVNAPLSENWLSRTAVRYESSDGFVKNVQDGSYLGGREVQAGRFTLGYIGFENTSMNFTFDYENREGPATAYHAATLPFRVGGVVDGEPPLISNLGAARNEINSDLSAREQYDRAEVYGFTGDIAIDLNDEYKLTSITAARGHTFSYQEDTDGLPFVIDTFGLNQKAKYYSQEFRLNFDNGENIQWFAGASYYNESLQADLYNIVDVALALEENAPNGVLANEANNVKGSYTGYAVYGDITFALTEKLELTFGARYTYDEKDFSLTIPDPVLSGGDSDDFAGFIFGYSANSPVTKTSDWSELTPRVALTYHFTDDLTGFASFSTGYKSGGFDTNALVLPANFTPFCGFSTPGEAPSSTLDGDDCPVNLINYDTDVSDTAQLAEVEPETIDSLEIGIKSQWLNNRLQINTSAFFYEYDNLQVSRTEGNTIFLENVGKLEGRGLEINARALLGEGFDIRFGFAYIDAEIGSIVEGVCSADCIGNMPTTTPRYQGSFVGKYSWPISAGEMSASYEYLAQSKIYGDFDNKFFLSGWNESNLRLNFMDKDDTWSANIYIENLFDQFHYSSPIYNDGGEFLSDNFSDPVKGRTMGFTVNRNF